MKHKWILGLQALAGIGAFSLVLKAFLEAYDLESGPYFWPYLLVLALVVTLVDWTWLRWPAYGLVYLGGLYFWVSPVPARGMAFFGSLANYVSQSLVLVRQGQVDTLGVQWLLALFLLAAIFYLELAIRQRGVLGASLALLAYLTLLAIYNQTQVGWDMLRISLLTFVIWRTYTVRSGLVFYVLLQGLILLLLSNWLASTPIQALVQGQTQGLRDRLNQAGFYDWLDSQAAFSSRQTGYSEDDSQLGGPLYDNQNPVFKVQGPNPGYWRIEAKDFYTGQGWQASPGQDQALVGPSITIGNQDYGGALQEETSYSLLMLASNGWIPLPYGVGSLTLDASHAWTYQANMERLSLDGLQEGQGLDLLWQGYDYQIQDLVEASTQKSQSQQDLQVPASLPQRVIDLALSLTQGARTPMEKIQAIQVYLKEDPRFTYSKTGAVAPGPDQDFVDFFLFESPIGYCDYFSTAMTILLRVNQIPARWVKGFYSAGAGDQDYQVTNKDAHSWVEVWLEGYGWLPMDPTPGFRGQVTALTQATSGTQEVTTSETNSQAIDQVSSSDQAMTSQETSTNLSTDPSQESGANWTRPFLWTLALLVASLGVFLAWQGQRLWFLYLTKTSPRALLRVYPHLLRRMERQQARNTGEALIDYAQRLEGPASWHQAWIDLTKAYEASLYGGLELGPGQAEDLLRPFLGPGLTKPPKNSSIPFGGDKPQ